MEKGCLIAAREDAELSIGKNVYINRNGCIVARGVIKIENNVTIGPNCVIYDHDHDLCKRGMYTVGQITIKENVWIGANVTILKDVIIGKNSVIAAGTIVTKDIPDNCVFYQKRENLYKEK